MSTARRWGRSRFRTRRPRRRLISTPRSSKRPRTWPASPSGDTVPSNNFATPTRNWLQVSRMSAIGEMASGIAHELNQPLAAIVNHAFVLEKQACNPGRRHRFIESPGGQHWCRSVACREHSSPAFENWSRKPRPPASGLTRKKSSRRRWCCWKPKLKRNHVIVQKQLPCCTPKLPRRSRAIATGAGQPDPQRGGCHERHPARRSRVDLEHRHE